MTLQPGRASGDRFWVSSWLPHTSLSYHPEARQARPLCLQATGQWFPGGCWLRADVFLREVGATGTCRWFWLAHGSSGTVFVFSACWLCSAIFLPDFVSPLSDSIFTYDFRPFPPLVVLGLSRRLCQLLFQRITLLSLFRSLRLELWGGCRLGKDSVIFKGMTSGSLTLLQ